MHAIVSSIKPRFKHGIHDSSNWLNTHCSREALKKMIAGKVYENVTVRPAGSPGSDCKRKRAAKRTLISPRSGKRYVRRDTRGRFDERMM